MKDYMKVIITALLTAIITLTVAGAFDYPKIQNEKFEMVEKNANTYTDKKMEYHESKDAVRFKSIDDKLEDTKGMVKFLYERELNKSTK